ncbi:MAG TPA: nucleotidyltransferase family protein [Nocardioides sp.]|nr:nucleotidyltransferase family protein [Nocardioides sp.]
MDAPAGLTLVTALCRSALEVEEGRPAAPPALGGIDARALFAVVQRHRVQELLASYADELGLPAELVRILESWRALARQRTLLQTLETVRAWELLDRAGVSALAFKGQPLAVQTTGRADARGPGDVDLLVDPQQLVEAHRALTAAGWSLREGARIEPGTWAWRHVSRWGNALTYRGEGADVDLHWRLEITPDAHPPFDVLRSRAEEVALGASTVTTLSRYDALRHLAAHREGWIWLRTLVDLRRLCRADPGDPDDPDDPADPGNGRAGVLTGPLRPAALRSLAVARATVGLPDSVPASVHARLDRTSPEFLARVARHHAAPVPATFSGGVGGVLGFRHRLAASRSVRDLQHTTVALVLPAHAAYPVDARTAWTGVPRALARRAAAALRALAGRAARPLRRGGPCAERPGRAA